MATRKWVVAIATVVAVWMGGYIFLSRDPDATAYRELCLQSAQSALDGLGTARLATDDGLLPTYQTALNDDAQKLIERARSQVVGQVPPDEPSTRRRDTLVPLLDRAERLYEDLEGARTADGVRSVTDRMATLERQLRDFIDGNR
jgi:hypothetical protein